MKIIYIGFGGFLGAVVRYVIARFFNQFVVSFPLGTFVVNVVGSLILGFFLYAVNFGKTVSPNFRDFLAIGFIGAFTTMSTFAYESFRLFETKEFFYFSLNVFITIFSCLTAIFIGREIALIITTTK
jgi:CrcB protein